MGARLAICLFLVACPARSEERFLVVFSDGGFLQVQGAQLAGENRLRLHLSEGATLEVPLTRVEKVIEATLAQEPAREAGLREDTVRCSPQFVAEPLPAGTPFAQELQLAGQRANLHPRLLAAVVAVESGFNPLAVSPVGARGLMQLMPAVWLAYGLLEPHHPLQNLLAGAAHLRRLLDRFGRLDWALAAYNAGAAVVASYDGIPPYRETQQYVQAVLARFCPDTT